MIAHIYMVFLFDGHILLLAYCLLIVFAHPGLRRLVDWIVNERFASARLGGVSCVV